MSSFVFLRKVSYTCLKRQSPVSLHLSFYDPAKRTFENKVNNECILELLSKGFYNLPCYSPWKWPRGGVKTPMRTKKKKKLHLRWKYHIFRYSLNTQRVQIILCTCSSPPLSTLLIPGYFLKNWVPLCGHFYCKEDVSVGLDWNSSVCVLLVTMQHADRFDVMLIKTILCEI